MLHWSRFQKVLLFINKRFQEYYCGCSWAKLRRKKTDVSSIENALVWMGPWTKDIDVTVLQIRKRVQLGIQRAMSVIDLHH